MLIRCNRFLQKYNIYYKHFLCLFLEERCVENVLQFITSKRIRSVQPPHRKTNCLKRRPSLQLFLEASFQYHTKTCNVFVSTFIIQKCMEH